MNNKQTNTNISLIVFVFQSLLETLEETYDNDYLFLVQESRLARQKFGKGYKLDLFSKVGPIYVSCTVTPPRKDLVGLINLCSGQVSSNPVETQ